MCINLVRAYEALKDTSEEIHKEKQQTVNIGTINSHDVIILYSKELPVNSLAFIKVMTGENGNV